MQLYVKPQPGRAPRHETTHQPLSPAGEWWPDSPYTRRRLRDGDIVQANAPETEATTAVKPGTRARASKQRSS